MGWFSRNPSSTRETTDVWPSVGVLFNIDGLLAVAKRERGNDYNYGVEARVIFMKHLDPARVGPAFLFDGDTNATLNGTRRECCIAIAAQNRAGIDAVRSTFAGLAADGLAPIGARLIAQPVNVSMVHGEARVAPVEPLPLWLAINTDGEYVISRPNPDDVWLCQKTNRRFRLGDKLSRLVEQLPRSDSAIDALTSSSLTYEEIYTVLVAADPRAIGMPRALSRLMARYGEQKSDHYWVALNRLDRLTALPYSDIVAREDAHDLMSSMIAAGQSLVDRGEVLDGALDFFKKVVECSDPASAAYREAEALRARCEARLGS